jgi:hypothetical protein
VQPSRVESEAASANEWSKNFPERWTEPERSARPATKLYPVQNSILTSHWRPPIGSCRLRLCTPSTHPARSGGSGYFLEDYPVKGYDRRGLATSDVKSTSPSSERKGSEDEYEKDLVRL